MKLEKVAVVFAIVVLLFLVACSQDDDTQVPAGFLEAADDGPFDCLPEYYNDGKGSESAEENCTEDLRFFWDGVDTLHVRHYCTSFNCSFAFIPWYRIQCGHLVLIEQNTSGTIARCTCNYDLTYRLPISPGAYHFALKKMHKNGDHMASEGDFLLVKGQGELFSFGDF